MIRTFLFFPAWLLGATLAHALIDMPDATLRARIEAEFPGAIVGEQIDETHPGVQAATMLDLSYAGIQDLWGIQAFMNVLQMNVSGNPITSLFGPAGLQQMYAADCALTGTLYVPYNLQYLSVRSNAITSVVLTSENLVWLNARDNRITGLTGAGLENSFFGFLDIAENELTSFPNISTAHLYYCDVSHNQLTSVPLLSGITQFNASYNQIQALTGGFWTVGGPMTADLSHNLIQSVGDLAGWSVTDLDLGHNPLTQGIDELPSTLTTFRVQSTQLPCLPWLPQGLVNLYCTGNTFTCLPNMPPSLSLAQANYGFTPTLCGATSPCYIAPVQLRLRTCLQGAWDVPTQLMRDDLRAQGLLPLTEPYTAMGWSYVGNTAPLSVPAARFAVTGPRAIVDWVVIEVREGGMPGALRQSMPALLRRDGYVISTTGDSLIRLNVARGEYRVAVRHRNHFTGINFAAQGFSNDVRTIDLMVPGTTQVNAYTFYHAANGVRMLFQGDITGDHLVKYIGDANDRDPILQAIGGVVPTNTVTGQYRREDVNMDGVVRYTGNANDRDPILQSIGGTTPTNVRTQVPLF